MFKKSASALASFLPLLFSFFFFSGLYYELMAHVEVARGEGENKIAVVHWSGKQNPKRKPARQFHAVSGSLPKFY